MGNVIPRCRKGSVGVVEGLGSVADLGDVEGLACGLVLGFAVALAASVLSVVRAT